MCATKLRWLVGFMLLAITSAQSEATRRRVPADYPTIQQALDAVEYGDTVLLAAGVYHEALRAPVQRFCIAGEVNGDSSEPTLPTIDPTPLPGSDSLACLYLPSNSYACLLDLRFRNGPEMLDSASVSYPGGIIMDSDTLIVERCVFDSVRRGIFSNSLGPSSQQVTVYQCRFNDCQVHCIRTTGRVVADQCDFSGPCWQGILGGARSVITLSTFHDNDHAYMLQLGGDSLVVENCIFGPDSASIFPKVHVGLINGSHSCRIRNNIFHDVALGSCILEIAMNCPNAVPLPFVVEDNTFRNFWNQIGQGGSAINALCQGNDAGYFGHVDRNTFEDGVSSVDANGTGVRVVGSLDLNGNRFARLNPDLNNDVFGVFSAQDTVRIRGCYFDADGRAVGYVDTYMDARENWWGDSTGPYEPSRNPQGQGGEIMPDVLFEPWIHDTLELAAEREPLPIPLNDQLEVYPNPFNAASTIRLAVREPGIYRLDLFDITGRLTREIWTGPVAYRRDLKFEAGALPSGVYLLRARRVPHGKNIALIKMVLMK